MLDVGDDGLSQRLLHAITGIRVHSFTVRESYSIGSQLLNAKVSGNFFVSLHTSYHVLYDLQSDSFCILLYIFWCLC